uniref:Peroxide-inducible transcript 1 protein n=1 Tax=Romanomermis culicivorax TaxID=13658 RepID=A0A915JAN7_ROMCU
MQKKAPIIFIDSVQCAILLKTFKEDLPVKFLVSSLNLIFSVSNYAAYIFLYDNLETLRAVINKEKCQNIKHCPKNGSLKRCRLKFRPKPYVLPQNSRLKILPSWKTYRRSNSTFPFDDMHNTDFDKELYLRQLYKLRSAIDVDDFANLLPMSLLDRRQISAAAKSLRMTANFNPNFKCFKKITPGVSNIHAITCSTQARLNNKSTTNNNNASNINSSDTTIQMPVITIGELAAYFEEFVHLPKKMSAMAENMYN